MVEEPETRGHRSRLDSPAVYVGAVLLLLLIGGGVCAYLILNKPAPSGEVDTTPGRLVHVFKAQQSSHRMAITVYGTTRASEVWTAIAEVNGRAIEVDPRFEVGEILRADTLLVRIDKTDYVLAVDAFQADAEAKRVQLKELEQTKENLDEIVELQRRQLELAVAERDRLSKAFQRGAVSRSVLEVAEIACEQNRTRLQETLNSLALLPVQRELTTAQLQAATAHLKQAQRDLEECDIRLPMAARCASKSIEDNQYVTAGERLGTFLSLQTTEVVAMLETRRMPALFPEGIKEIGTLDLAEMDDDGESFWRRIRIPVRVSWGLGDLRSVWWGRVARIGSSLDPGTRTVPVIIEVHEPYADVRPGIRPPLIPDAFCEMTLYGATVDDVVVIPRDALRDQRVYLLRDGKLHIQPVTVLAREKEVAVISKGIKTGDLVILTDLFPATEGMPLRGETLPNPVQARSDVQIPKDLFQQREESTP